ncbi:DUF4292 domain-containing protein [Lacinutrix sp. Bg11-31]|uniref:DUF4292 domain-containing protein n=1 Tax=Lacinutrix sp. Bg11-31 TaxID=2057808 RepID=UPI000C2FFF56|nr:DUF4292 domain-containing protein [Lacinutrix sp. Bg11-31]AUC82908.1 DUF4292 domain-containing protein [Lacinutrix sp. Bg11-31]
MTFKPQVVSLILILCIGFVSCRSAKTITDNGTLNANLSARQIIKNNAKSESKFKMLSARLKIESNDGKKSQSVSVSLRIEKGKTIWMSKLGIVKTLITPTRVAFYNKLDGTYFDGDFTYLSELLGTHLDFNKIQALLLGEPVFKPNTKDYEASVFEKSYLLQPKNQNDLFELFLLFNPTHFKMDSQEISQSKEKRLLEIDYLAYQEVEKEILPERIKILALENKDQLIIDLEYKGIELNQKLRFPFRIPSGYDQIELK